MLLRTYRASSARNISIRQFTRTLRTTPQHFYPDPPRRAQDRSSPPNLPSQDGDQDTSQTSTTPPPPPTPPPSISSTLASTPDASNNLLSPVHIPEDPHAILKSAHPATNLLAQSGLVVQRQIEMMNIFLGFEQANRYIIMDPHGNHVGYMAEHDGGFGRAIGRQAFRTHRAFTTHVFDREQREVLRFHRPFSWINSRIGVYDPLETSSSSIVQNSHSTELQAVPREHPDLQAAQHLSPLPLSSMRVIGEAHSEWAPLRRKYNLFLSHAPPSDLSPSQQASSFTQFAYVDEPFLSWDFSLRSASNTLIGSVNRNFAGWGRELFTDTGVYALRMDSAGLEEESQKSHIISNSNKDGRAYAEAVGGKEDRLGMTLDQRAVMLATAVTVDFDYFSRHSRSGGMGFMPLWMGGGGEAAGGAAGGAAAGGAAEAGAVGAGAVEAGGAVVGGAGRVVGGAAGAAGVGEGAAAGAGTLAGYEAMQRAAGRGEGQAQAPPPEQQPMYDDQSSQNTTTNEYGDNIESQSTQSSYGDSPQNMKQYGDQQDPGDVWGSGDGNEPWSGSGDSGGGGGEGGGGWLQWLWDNFFGGGGD